MSLTIPNTFTDGEVASADDVNENFSEVASWANNEAVARDGSVAFTGIPNLPASDPTSTNQAARKGYVDGRTRGILAYSTEPTDSYYSDDTTDGALLQAEFGVTFTMPDLTNGQHLRIRFICPQPETTGTVVEGDSMQVRVYKVIGGVQGDMVCYGQSPVPTNADLFHQGGASIVGERVFTASDFGVSAGTSVRLSPHLRLANSSGGFFRIHGSTALPWQLVVEVI